MTDQQALTARLVPHPVQLSNFSDVFSNINFARYTWNTFLYAGLSTVGVVISCIPVAYAFSRIDWRGRNVVFLLVLSTLMLPTQVTSVTLYILWAKQFHDWTGIQFIGTLKPLIIPSFFGDAFSIFLLRQFFLTIPKELTDAVRVDGGGHFEILRRVIIPLSKPAIAAVGALQLHLHLERLLRAARLPGGEHRLADALRRAVIVPRSAPRELEPHHGGRADLHDSGDHDLLPRAARVHRGHHAHRRQGVTPVPEPVRIAILGSGFIAAYHARARRRAARRRGRRGRQLAARVARQAGRDVRRSRAPTTDWRELVGDPGIDAVVVATPNSLHAEQTIAFLDAGQHVLVEKPMAMDVAEADAMVAAAERSSASLMVAHCWRFHPDVIALRDRIAAGELGEVVKTRGYGVHAKWGPAGWFVDPALAGGGALADMGVHAIDTARFLLGDPEPVAGAPR